MKSSEKPTVTAQQRGQLITHPAFGTITVSRPTSSPGKILFGSDIDHQHYVSVRIHDAEINRDLHRDWLHPGKTILEFSMSEVQWAKFVSGAGMSQATQITLDYVRDGEMVSVPSIERPKEDRKDQFNREFKEKLDKCLEQINGISNELTTLSESKSVKKGELKKLAFDLKNLLQNLPLNMEFTISSFKEASEEIVEHSKAEIEAYLADAVRQAGLHAIAATPDSTNVLSVDRPLPSAYNGGATEDLQ